MTGDAVFEHLLRGFEHLFDLDVLANALQYLVGTGLHADQQAAQAGLLAACPDLIGQPDALISAHGGRPGDLHPGLDDAIGKRLHAAALW